MLGGREYIKCYENALLRRSDLVMIPLMLPFSDTNTNGENLKSPETASNDVFVEIIAGASPIISSTVLPFWCNSASRMMDSETIPMLLLFSNAGSCEISAFFIFSKAALMVALGVMEMIVLVIISLAFPCSSLPRCSIASRIFFALE